MAAVQDQCRRYLHACVHVTPNDGYVRLAEALNERAPGAFAKKTHPYKAGFGPFAPEVYRLPYAYPYRAASSLTESDYGARCAQEIEDAFRRDVAADSVAAVTSSRCSARG